MAPRNIIITGASSGIGEALALALAAPGVTLGLFGRDAARLDRVTDAVSERGAIVRQGQFDIRDRDALRGFVDGFAAIAPLDLFIANAGILDGRTPDGSLETAEAARNLLDVNLLASIDCFHAALPHLRARRGQFAFVASLAGLAPLPDAPAYSASKAGLVSYGLAMRAALQEEGVRVSVVCPGYVTSQMTANHLGAKPGEIPAADAARRILAGLARNRDLIGFPFGLFWASRLAIVGPEWARRLGMKGLGFRVGRYDGQKPF